MVTRLRRRRALPRLATLPRQFRVRPDSVHQSDPRPTHRAHAQQRQQDDQIFLQGY